MATIDLTNYIEGYAEENWTFAKANTQYLTHAIHPYPARMIPQVAGKLIRLYSQKGETCLDPYCGSGTVLVESKLHKIKSIGIDLNPLAVIISKVKTTPIDTIHAMKIFRKILSDVENDMQKEISVEIPPIPNLDYWFKPEVAKKLAIIRNHIFEIRNEDILNFFKVCFSLTVRKSSNTRQGEFKLFRIPPYVLQDYNPDPIKIFTEIVERNMKSMFEFNQIVDKSISSLVLKSDLRNILRSGHPEIHEDCASLLVTSPPYGDSKTTVAYGQFSRYSSAWLDFDENEVRNVDNNILGGKRIKSMKSLESSTLENTILKIEEIDLKRALDVYSFFYDMDICFNQISRLMKRNKSHICFVLGNRTVKRFQIPSDKILIELGKKYGFSHIATKHREIPNKHMPRVNAPENVTSKIGETMSNENIIIWKY